MFRPFILLVSADFGFQSFDYECNCYSEMCRAH